MEELIQKLKKEIIEQLHFNEMSPDEIKEDAPLFGPDGLGLDSIDALELILILEKKYGLKISDMEKGKKILFSVKSMAEFIKENGK